MSQGEVPMFGLAKGVRMPVNVPMVDTIILANAGGTAIEYDVFVPAGDGTFECGIVPGSGVLKGKSTKHLALSFKLLQVRFV
jgi:hypothetical protein